MSSTIISKMLGRLSLVVAGSGSAPNTHSSNGKQNLFTINVSQRCPPLLSCPPAFSQPLSASSLESWLRSNLTLRHTVAQIRHKRKSASVSSVELVRIFSPRVTFEDIQLFGRVRPPGVAPSLWIPSRFPVDVCLTTAPFFPYPTTAIGTAGQKPQTRRSAVPFNTVFTSAPRRKNS